MSTMKYSYLTLLMVLCSIISLNTAEMLLKSVEEHYWRDFRGLIPTSAIPGGTDRNGNITYIAQMSLRTSGSSNTMEFIPAVVTHGSKVVIGTYQGRTVTSNENSNVKILCSGYPRRYYWHTSGLIEAGCRYVSIGQESLVPLYVGKATYNNQTLLGKVFSDDRYGKNLIAPYEGQELQLEKFAILYYCS